MDAPDLHPQLFAEGGEKIDPLLLGVQQRQGDAGLRQQQGQPGKAGSGAYVNNPGPAEVREAQQAQAVQKMTARRLLRPLDGGQVHDPVHFAEEGIIGFKALQRRGAQFQAPFRRAGSEHLTQAHAFR